MSSLQVSNTATRLAPMDKAPAIGCLPINPHEVTIHVSHIFKTQFPVSWLHTMSELK